MSFFCSSPSLNFLFKRNLKYFNKAIYCWCCCVTHSVEPCQLPVQCPSLPSIVSANIWGWISQDWRTPLHSTHTAIWRSHEREHLVKYEDFENIEEECKTIIKLNRVSNPSTLLQTKCRSGPVNCCTVFFFVASTDHSSSSRLPWPLN